MEPQKRGQTINKNTAKTSQNTASSSGTNGTQNEQEIIKIDVVKELNNIVEKDEKYFDEEEAGELIYANPETIEKYPKLRYKHEITLPDGMKLFLVRKTDLLLLRNNELFSKTPKEIKELSNSLTGLDKIIFDELTKKRAKKPGNNPGLWIFERGKSDMGFSVAELKHIITQNEAETQKKLIVVREQLERERQEVDETITNLETKLKEAGTQNIALIEEQEQKEKEDKNKKNQELENERTINIKLQKEKTALESSEQVAIRNLAEIKAEYEALQKQNQTDAECLNSYQQKVIELLALAQHKEQNEKVIMLEWQKTFSQFKQSNRDIEAKNARINILAREKAALEVNFNAEKREHQTTIKRKDRDIAFVQKYYEQEKAEKEQVQADKEALRQDYIRVCDERDKAIETSAPKWLNNLIKYSDRFLGTDIQKGTAAMWKRGRLYGRWLFFLFLASIALFILSWIVRILAAVFRNVKAIFTKKQNTAEILKELVSGVKEAKDSVIKSKPKEQPETKEAEVIEVQPINETSPIAQNPEAPAIKKNGKRKKKSKKKK